MVWTVKNVVVVNASHISVYHQSRLTEQQKLSGTVFASRWKGKVFNPGSMN